ncbi:MAG: acyl-CoA reductase [Saprospiraceae bacterium]|nr:acyl-CoA reductase [Saprospiraceae bacterium]
MNESQILEWKNKILRQTESKVQAYAKAEHNNSWFTSKEIDRMLDSITKSYLDASKYNSWIQNYNLNSKYDTVGLIAAGNIPLVLFHDVLCILATGATVKIKLSEKDSILPQWILNLLIDLDDQFSSKIEYVDRIQNVDAIIATGSDLSGNQFKSYFGKYPNIIRTHRNSIAVLSGNEDDSEIISLGEDVFSYYGLGCRNVSKIYVPENYDFEKLLRIWDENFEYVMNNNKYKNNFDYNLAIHILNKAKMFQSLSTLLVESHSLNSRIACVHYEVYKEIPQLIQNLNEQQDKIQDITSSSDISIPHAKRIGSSQYPELTDYADGVDTMKFLLKVS